jgi:Ca-activated chloride channel family protein
MRAFPLLLLLVLSLGGCSGPPWWEALWWTADQRGQRAFDRGDYLAAAQLFEDPLWRGTALYLQERFDAALSEFARVNSAEAWFVRGNALAHLERYQEAIEAYEQALRLRPGYEDARTNIDYLQPFLPLEFEGGTTGVVGRDAAADDVVFDADAERLAEQGRDTDVDEPGGLLSDEQMADLWLRQVDVSPATFLRQKFALQAARGESGP